MEVKFSFNPTTLGVRQPGIFQTTVSGTDSEGDPINRYTPKSFSIDWGDGDPNPQGFGGRRAYQHPGTYTIVASATLTETGETASADPVTVTVS